MTDDGGYKSPSDECDLIMKGGIASGVVYGSAVARIAQDYRFRSVAGTSAGAIAAVVAAAAEYRRQTLRRAGRADDFSGFDEVVRLTDELAKGIEDLFQAEGRYRPLLKGFIATTTAPEGAGFLSKFRRFFRAFAGWGEAAAFVVIAALAVFVLGEGDIARSVFLGFWAVLAPLIVSFARFAHLLLTLDRSDFGMCSGLGADGRPGLTDWIHNAVQEVSGKRDGAPLTVGDLWGEPDEDGQMSPGVDLVTMTTDLTSSRPYRTPLSDEHHYFTETEMARLFPRAIVEHLKRKGEVIGTIRPAKTHSGKGGGKPRWAGDVVYRMPPAPEFPVVISARLSLSFPVLFTTVPLWRVDNEYSAAPAASDADTLVVDLAGGGGTRVLRRCLFSDGGITSNFPIHFFDSFLPRRPTFGIMLTQWSVDHDGEAPRPEARDDDALRKRIRLYDIESAQHRKEGAPAHDDLRTRPIGGALGFFMRIVDTAKDWRDLLQSRLPGNAERIVRIRLTPGEGGYNLAMDEATLKRMNAIGRLAGEELVRSFAKDGHRRFDDHRFMRALSFLQEFRDRVDGMGGALDKPAGIGGLRGYPDLLKSYSGSGFSNDLNWRLQVEEYVRRIAALREDAPALRPGDPGGLKILRQRASLRVAAEAQAADWPTRPAARGDDDGGAGM